jgi:hypothetical protein
VKAKGEAVTASFLSAILGVFIFTCAWAAIAAPPTVIKTIPNDGATNVDPALKELRVVFDQAMSPDGMSIVGGGPAFPKFFGKPHWENDRTLVFAWRLEPRHDYWLSINNDNFTNFRGANGESAVPHPVSFHTINGTNTTAISFPAANHEAAMLLKRAIDDDYSFRDLRHVDWKKQFKEFTPQLESASDARQFAEVAARLIEPARDVHFWLEVDNDIISAFRREAPWNIVTSRLPQQIPHWQQRSSIVATGVFDDGIRYIFIESWPADGEAELAAAFQAVTEAAEAGRPLIIDVRANGGGSENRAQDFAGCFVDHPVVYAKSSTRHDGKWGPVVERTLDLSTTGCHFRGRVAVLMGQGTVSSSESFVMMMKQCPNCTLVGDHTAGCSGNPHPVDLGNGVTAFVPSWKDLRLDGTCTEGEGFAPDVLVKTTDESFEKDDPVVAAALQILRK